MPNIKINGQSYDSAKLSKAAKAQLSSIQAADQEITRLKVQLAIETKGHSLCFRWLFDHWMGNGATDTTGVGGLSRHQSCISNQRATWYENSDVAAKMWDRRVGKFYQPARED